MTEVGMIHEALLEVRRKVLYIGKSQTNSKFNFKYRGIEQVLEKVGPELRKANINVRPRLVHYEFRDVTTGVNQTRMREVTVHMEYTYVHAGDGSEFAVIVPGEAFDAASSATSKAMSTALRIAHLQTLQIPVSGEDADATESRVYSKMEKLSNEIVAVGRTIGLVAEDGKLTTLYDDFALWSQGVKASEATEELLRDYLKHITPKTKMARKPVPRDNA